MISILHNDLKTLISSSILVPEEQYCIIDYVTTVSKANYNSACYKFDIVVTALNTNTLYEYATLLVNSTETYFDANAFLLYNIKYNVNNEIPGYLNDWVDANGKGCIYYMTDNKGNEAPFDFKNIKYNGKFLFNNTIDGSDTSQTISEYNSVKEVIEDGVFKIPQVSFNDECHSVTIDTNASEVSITECSNLQIGNNCSNSIFATVNNVVIGNDVIDSELTLIDGGEIGDNNNGIIATNQTNLIIKDNNTNVTLGSGSNGVIIDSNNTNVTIGTNAKDVYINGSKTIDLGNNIEQFNISSSYDVVVADDCKLFTLNETNHLTSETLCNSITCNNNNYITIKNGIENIEVTEGIDNIVLDGSQIDFSEYKTLTIDDINYIVTNANTGESWILNGDGTLSANPNGKLVDAPSDGNTYGRKDGNWEEIDAYTKTESDGKYETIENVANLLANKANTSHTHTKSEVGLANVDNTTDLLKPISNATQGALDGKLPMKGKATTNLQVGQSFYNILNFRVPTAANTQRELTINTKIPLSDASSSGTITISGIAYNKQSPFELTISYRIYGGEVYMPASGVIISGTWQPVVKWFNSGGFLCLAFIDADPMDQMSMKIDVFNTSTSAANYMDNWTWASTTGIGDATNITGAAVVLPFKFTPHTHTKSEVGLANVDNTSDANKPISTATQTALNSKANTSHTHTKSEIGLANVDNTSDLTKPISTATQTALNSKANTSHTHTKSDVGLSNVDNTSDISKPISTATQDALNTKAPITGVPNQFIIGRTYNNVFNKYFTTSPTQILIKTGCNMAISSAIIVKISGYVHYSASIVDLKLMIRFNGGTFGYFKCLNSGTFSPDIQAFTYVDGSVTKLGFSFKEYLSNTTLNISVEDEFGTYVSSGWSSEDNAATGTYFTLSNPVNPSYVSNFASKINGVTYTGLSDITIQDTTKAPTVHTHTKSEVGLANVDNTSDVNKPISTATQTALNSKANTSHTHTKSEVGLANVDNTSDANKPISNATQTALNSKANTSHTHDANAITSGDLSLDRLFKMKKYVESRGENLVTNGTGLLKNNTNFSRMTYSGAESYNCDGSFTTASGSWMLTDESMPVNPDLSYRLLYYIKAKPWVDSAILAGIACFDTDGLEILPKMTMYVPNTLTTLSEDLKDGDTTVKFTNLTNNWVNVAGTGTYNRTLIFWNYVSSSGKSYPELTYSRNVFLNSWDPGAVNYATNTITLNKPWSNGTIVAGTKVSNGNDGSTYKYLGDYLYKPTTEWTAQQDRISGIDLSGTNYPKSFHPGTASIRLVFGLNRNVTGGQHYISNISFGVDTVTTNTLTSHITSNLHLTEGQRTKLEGIAAGAEVNVNADWNATTGDAQILNKPNTLSGYGITDTPSDNKTYGRKNGNWSEIDTISIAYTTLKNLRNSGQLVPGQSYKITDYMCTTITTNTRSANKQFDIIVIALDENTLSENASAVRHNGDTYFTNAKLEAWEIKYCINNDTSRFAWADNVNGKGVIYYMKDEYDNELPYDFKNIQYLKNGVWVYTFGGAIDNSLVATCSNNKINPYISSNKQILNNITFGTNCQSNIFGINCHSNTFGNSCFYNTFGDGCYSNTFGNDCGTNNFGDTCGSNTFGNDCQSNTFGYDCYYNIFGVECYSNTFGTNCNYNTFGNNYRSNTFGYDCRSNNFYDGSIGSTTTKNFIRYITLEDGVRNNNFYSTINNSGTSYLEMIRIKGLDNATPTDITITLPITDTKYGWVIAKNSYGIIKQYCPENLVDTVGGINIISIPYTALKNLRDSGQLVPGQSYRIIDYITTTSQTDTQSAGNVFDIIVTALSTNKLSENASAIKRDNDTYFTYAKVEAWELKYCLDNDTNRFAWANTSIGKGVIYYMKDEHNNECSYDFKNIKFTKNSNSIYTFGGTTDSTNQTTLAVYNNNIKPCIFNSKYELGFNTFGTLCRNNYLDFNCKNNTFGTLSINNTFGTGCENNNLGEQSSDNTFEDGCKRNVANGFFISNSMGIGCLDNTFGETCRRNKFGEMCNNNTFADACNSNVLEDLCTHIIIGEGSYVNYFSSSTENNRLGKNCCGIKMGHWCDRNTFGDGCLAITFEMDCNDNKFGNSCNFINFGPNCHHNILGNSCANIIYEASCKYNNFFNGTIANPGTVKDYLINITLEQASSYNNFYSNTITNNSGNMLKMIRIRVSGTQTGILMLDTQITNTTLNRTNELLIARNSAGVVKQYCLEDLIP